MKLKIKIQIGVEIVTVLSPNKITGQRVWKWGYKEGKSQKVTNCKVRGTAKTGQTRANLVAIAGKL